MVGPVSAAEVFGMELRTASGDEDIQPVAALVIVKVFDPDNEAGCNYLVRATDGLTTVEAYGMAKLAETVLLRSGAFRPPD